MSRAFRAANLVGLSMLCIGCFADIASAQLRLPQNPPAVPRSTSENDATYLFLSTPASLDEFWRKLDSPDFVLISGSTYKSMLNANPGRPNGSGPSSALVTSVSVGGRASSDLARLSIRLGLTANQAERVWVPIGLEGLAAIASVQEAGKDLPIRAAAKGGWEVELSGAGKHELILSAIARISQSGDERKISVPIPVCSSTSLDLEVEQRIVDAVIGEKELVSLTPGLDGERTRVVASLTPRDRIVLSWRAETAASLQLPPLLDAEGELAVDVDPDWVRIRSTWHITSGRGISKALVIALDPNEELLEVELDGRTVPNEAVRDPKSSKLIVNLAEPLRQGTARRLALSTRRKLVRGQANKIVLNGYPIENAQVQTGAISINKSRPVFVDAVVGRFLRRIDPRTELPEELRVRPGTVLAYQFADQPFNLALLIDPAPPRIRVEPRTTVTVGDDRIGIDAWLDFNTTRGQVFDVEVDLVQGLELERWGPEDIVAGAEYARDDTSTPDVRERSTRLILHLTSKAREAGSFRIHLSARQPLGAATSANVELLRPRGETPLGGLVALVSTPGVDVSLVRPPGSPTGAEFLALNLPAPPADWTWPADTKPEARATAAWLRQPSGLTRLPVQVARRTRLLTHETASLVDVHRQWVDVEQETLVAVPFGTLGKLDISIPAEVGAWSVDSPTLAANDLLATEKNGVRRYRLTLDREFEGSARFRFRYRLPLTDSGSVSKVALTELTPIDARSLSQSIRINAQAGLDVSLNATGWTSERPDTPGDRRARERFRLTRQTETAPFPALVVRADPILSMPALVASRLFLSTVLRSDGELKSTARFSVDSHGAAIDIELPPGSRWVRAEVNDRVVSEIESRPTPDHYRIVLPDGLQSGTITLMLDIRSPSSGRAGVQPIKLTDGIIQQTYWEFRVPWNQLALGIPAGWNDENRWEWQSYAWKRQPGLSSTELSSWVAGSSARMRSSDLAETDARSGEHSYLFSRVGEPDALRISIHSKALILVLCTGFVSLIGVLTVLLRIPGRFVLGGVVGVGLGLVVIWDASVAFTLFQSSIFGVFLTLSAAALQWVVDRRRGDRHLFTDRMGSTLSRTLGDSTTDSPLPPPAVGSDDSTTIRKRPASPPPSDQIVLAPPATFATEGSTTSTPPR